LRLAEVAREADGHILEGALHCTNTQCLREFPIIDGIPLIVANIRQYVSDNILPIFGRADLTAFTESMVGDCCGPSSPYDLIRQHLSSYAWDHYGDLDPGEASAEPRPGSVLRILQQGCDLLRSHDGAAAPGLAGPILDAGCSVGRSTFALAERTDDLVLGVDLHFAMLRVAAGILRSGVARYPQRRVGLVYDRREFPVEFRNLDRVDFWACDVTALPFPPATLKLATALNLLDCVAAPREMLIALGRVLASGGKALLTCPYDWSVGATPLEAWLGGHSQRAASEGSSIELLRLLLQPGAHPAAVQTLRLAGELDNLPWHVRLHDRSVMTYKTHMVVAEKVG
jgi:SAM-dependent methyltransferase